MNDLPDLRICCLAGRCERGTPHVGQARGKGISNGMNEDQPRLMISDAFVWNADKVKFRVPGFAMIALTTGQPKYVDGRYRHGGVYLSWFLKVGTWMTSGWYPNICRPSQG